MTTNEMTTKKTRAIFVIDAGWVLMAESYTIDAGFGVYALSGASVIRVWGTTNGLGEIALGGPTKDTVLDPCGNVLVPTGKVLMIIPCVYE